MLITSRQWQFIFADKYRVVAAVDDCQGLSNKGLGWQKKNFFPTSFIALAPSPVGGVDASEADAEWCKRREFAAGAGGGGQ